MQLLSYFDVISSALVVYDALLTIELEVGLIWKAPWSLLKVVYLVQKYLPFIDAVALGLRHQFASNLSAEACYIDYNVAGYMFIVGVTLSEVILTWRVWAVWHRNKKLAVFLPVIFISIFAPTFAIANLFLSSIKFSPLPFDQVGCFITAANPILYLLWVLLMVYDVVVLVLMCIPGISAYKMGGNSGLFKAVYRDGILYYLYQLAVSVLNVVFTLTLPADLSSILTSTGRVMQAILTSRVLLHIRKQTRANVIYADPELRRHGGGGTSQTDPGNLNALVFAPVQTVNTENGSSAWAT